MAKKARHKIQLVEGLIPACSDRSIQAGITDMRNLGVRISLTVLSLLLLLRI